MYQTFYRPYMFCNIVSILIARFDEFEFTKNEHYYNTSAIA